jgi:hypothetical protein
LKRSREISLRSKGEAREKQGPSYGFGELHALPHVLATAVLHAISHTPTPDNVSIGASFTYYLQKLMHEAFIDCDAGTVCDKTLLDTTYLNMLEEARENTSKLLGALTEHQKNALYAIAREGKAERVLSAAFIKRHALVSTSSMQSAIKKLIEMELISTHNSTYSLTDIMMRLYITEGMD